MAQIKIAAKVTPNRAGGWDALLVVRGIEKPLPRLVARATRQPSKADALLAAAQKAALLTGNPAVAAALPHVAKPALMAAQQIYRSAKREGVKGTLKALKGRHIRKLGEGLLSVL